MRRSVRTQEFHIPRGHRNYLRARELAVAKFTDALIDEGMIKAREERVETGWKLVIELLEPADESSAL